MRSGSVPLPCAAAAGAVRCFLGGQRGDWQDVGVRLDRTRRALQVTKVAREAGLRRVLAEIGAVGNRQATREGARGFREALEELGTTYASRLVDVRTVAHAERVHAVGKPDRVEREKSGEHEQ